MRDAPVRENTRIGICSSTLLSASSRTTTSTLSLSSSSRISKKDRAANRRIETVISAKRPSKPEGPSK